MVELFIRVKLIRVKYRHFFVARNLFILWKYSFLHVFLNNEDYSA